MTVRRSIIPWAFAALAGALSLVARAAAGAEPVRVYLDYSRAAATCIDEAALKHGVEARLGRAVFVTEVEADVRAVVIARRAARGFSASVELFDRARQSLGRRELATPARHCSALDDSLALVLSLAADMPRERLSPPPENPSAPSAPPQAPSEPSAPPQLAPPFLGTPLSIPEAAPRIGLRLLPEIGVAASYGLLPSLAPGLDVGLELRSNRFWPMSVHAAGWARQVQEVGRAGRAARFSAQTVSLAICPWSGPLGPLDGSLCALNRLGRVAARGTGFDDPQQSTGWQVAIGAGGGVRYWLGPMFVSGAGELLVPLLRRRYFFTDVEDITIHEEGWLQALLRLGVGTEI
jgi:hypothetical protein